MIDRVPVATEKEFQSQLVDLLQTFGWTVQHVYSLATKHGYRTGTTSAGWPDLVAVRRDIILAIEVKGPRTPVEQAQLAWLDRFARVSSARAWLLRPDTAPFDALVRWVRHPRDAPRIVGWHYDEAGAPRAKGAMLTG